MTIRTGDVYVVESLSQFKDLLAVHTAEIVDALPTTAKREIVDRENTFRGDIDKAEPITVDTIGEAHSDTVAQFLNEYGTNSIIIDVLEARDQEYVHIYDSPAHRIVELQPNSK